MKGSVSATSRPSAGRHACKLCTLVLIVMVLAMALSDGATTVSRAAAVSPASSPHSRSASTALHALQQAELKDPRAAAGDNFGCSVAISGDTVLVGVSHKTVGKTKSEAGVAYIFTRSGKKWSQQARLSASDSSAWSAPV